MAIPTRRVILLASGDQMLINAVDFDESKHGEIAVADLVPALRQDGPTLEEFVQAGYRAIHYPPSGWAERESPGLIAYRALSPEERERYDAPPKVDPSLVGSGGTGTVTATAGGSLDTTPGNIATVNMDQALALVAKASSLDELATFEAAESMNSKKPGGRTGIMKAIAERRVALTPAG